MLQLTGMKHIVSLQLINKTMRNQKQEQQALHLKEEGLLAKEEDILAANQEIINNLNKKIDRRLNIGYYCNVPGNSRTLIFPPRKHSPPKNTSSKRKHPIIKKIKRPGKVNMIDQQQNTDERELMDEWQNTSKIYVQFQPSPDVADHEMQFSPEKNQIDQQIQYTLESQIVECQDASIQYTIQEEAPEVKENPPDCESKSIQAEDEKKQQSNNYAQCEHIQRHEVSLQHDETKAELRSQQLQIDLPDHKQLAKMSEMEGRIKYLSLMKIKQQKLNKKAKEKMQILKLRQELIRLQKQIGVVESKQQLQNERLEKQIELRRKEQEHINQKKSLEKKYEREAKNQINSFIQQIKSMQKRPTVNSKYIQEEKKKQQQLKKQEMLQKQEMIGFRKDLQALKSELKQQMFKRMNFQNESQQDTEMSFKRRRTSSQILRQSLNRSLQISSIPELFPQKSPSKQRYFGLIVKNAPVNPESPEKQQRKVNEHYKSVRQSKQYWKSKSSFNYQFSKETEERQQRKNKYLSKLNEKFIQIKKNDQQLNETPFCAHQQANPQKYIYNGRLDRQKLQQIKLKIDKFFSNSTYFKYLYGQSNKISAGYELFSIFDVGLVEKNSIQIHKLPHYFVFSYKKVQDTHFIVIYNDKQSIMYSKFPTKQTEEDIFSSQNLLRQFWGCHYVNQHQIYMGNFVNGKKQGYGMLIQGEHHYQGQFKHDKKEGKGTLLLQNGDTYKGFFTNNFFQGEGDYLWSNGEKYSGYFKRGIKDGYGKQLFKNGDSYQGFYENNCKHGKGLYKWRDGSIYEGQFANDVKCGQGQMITSSGLKTTGIWRDDAFQKNWSELKEKRVPSGQLPLLKRKK